MNRRDAMTVAILCGLLVVPTRAGDEDLFEAKVRPVLAGTCFPCHGGKKVGGGLRVDSRDALLAGGSRGPAIVAGKPDESLIVQALRHEDQELAMPPGKNLGGEVAADFARWIKQGAIWPDLKPAGFDPRGHWSFQPIRAIAPPGLPSDGSANPIDRFLAAKRREAGLTPAPPADKRTLLRRVTFDLTGLPPSPDDARAFLADESTDAYKTVVERLLASPRYGERWGRHWLDVAHYADTAGDNADYPVPEARLYRDYVIDAFNDDLPYDQFVREQIAGDLLAKAGPRDLYARRVTATGFLALSRRYATGPEELWHLTLEDTIETTGRAFLGLTLRCARCHDHKFDPITKEDYYALYGIFASTRLPYAGSEELHSKGFNRERFQPLVPPDEAEPRMRAYRDRIGFLDEEIRRLQESPEARQVAEWNASIDLISKAAAGLEAAKQDSRIFRAQLASLVKRRDESNRRLGEKLHPPTVELRTLRRLGLPPDLPSAFAVQEGTPKDERVHLKGDPETPGAVVPRGVPKSLQGREPVSIPPDASGRLQLAEWLARPDHPLTARVMVNRIWQHHFGKGIVTTPSNFGVRGEEPTHPELLDWLAARFVASGWSVKAIHRLILTSDAYQMASTSKESAQRIDPANSTYWRFDRRRLSAEEIRDTMLLLGGHLDFHRPGPHPFPPISDWTWTQHTPFKTVFPSNHRTVYLMTQRLQKHPFLALFDGPDTNHSTDVRTSSTVPLQALYMMNNPFVREQATGLADRMLASASAPNDRVAMAYELCWGRPADADEIRSGRALVANYAEAAVRSGASPAEADRESWAAFARAMISANAFFYVD